MGNKIKNRPIKPIEKEQASAWGKTLQNETGHHLGSDNFSQNEMPYKNGGSLIASFKYASSGIVYAIKNELNMRIHICALILILYFARFYNLTKLELALVLAVCMCVLALEMVNTAIEAFLDKLAPEYCKRVKVAKDAAAGAVLTASVFAAAIGIILFWDIEVFKKIYYTVTQSVQEAVMLCMLIPVLIIFSVYFKKSKKGKNNS